MPWDNSPAKRAQDARVYGDPEYKRNRALAIHRAGGRCEHLDGGKRCNSRDRISVDHIKAVSQGGTHHLDNLRVLCRPHHLAKTATEGGGYRAQAAAADPPLQQRTQW